MLFLQSVICLFTRSRLYSKVLLYLWAAGSWSLKYVYFGSISSLIQISLNIIDILYLHIFFWIRSNSRITFIVYVDIKCLLCLMKFVYTYIYIYIYIYLAIPLHGQDVIQGQFFKRSWTGLKAELSFSYASCHTKFKEPGCPTIYSKLVGEWLDVYLSQG